MLMVMYQPTQQPAPGRKPDYDFIMNPPKGPKKSLLVVGSKRKRILVVAFGAIGLICAIMVFFSLLGSGEKNEVNRLLSIAQKQSELIRVAGIGKQKANTSEVINLATTTELTMQSAQPAMLDILKSVGHKADPKELALAKDSNTDTILTAADQNNEFDSVFAKVMQQELLEYQQALKIAYESAGNKTKAKLSEQYDAANLLIKTSEKAKPE